MENRRHQLMRERFSIDLLDSKLSALCIHGQLDFIVKHMQAACLLLHRERTHR